MGYLLAQHIREDVKLVHVHVGHTVEVNTGVTIYFFCNELST